MTPTRLLLPGALLILLATFSSTGHAGRATVEFIDSPGNPGSSPTNLAVANGRLYFAADDGLHGVELWQVDESGAVGLACDLNPGTTSSSPRSIVPLNGLTCFLTDYPGERGLLAAALGRLCGPGSCATSVTQVEPPDARPADPSFCINVRGTLFLDSLSPRCGRELWRYRSEADDITLVCETIPGLTGGLTAGQAEPRVLGTKLLFKAACPYDPVPGSHRLWVSDGTEDGTYCLLPQPPIPQGRDHGEPNYVAVIGDQAFFEGANSVLWVTDGTREGTRLVKEVPLPRGFCGFGGIVYFQADDGEHGPELWRTDGTSEGTWLVKDINPGPQASGAYHLCSLGDCLLFSADDGVHGYELWRSDGTASGTQLVKDIYEGPTSSNLYQPTVFGEALIFAADHPLHGEELWRSDGTQAGTQLVKDIHPGPGISEPYSLTVFNDQVYFCANDGVHGEELWRTDGTMAGTVLAADVNPARRYVRSSNPTNLCANGHFVFFSADDVTHGAELWAFDARFEDTFLVKDINPGPAHADPEELTSALGLLLFVGDDGTNGRGLWRSDGTRDGTQRIALSPAGVNAATIHHLASVGQAFLFVATDANGDEQICRLAAPDQQPETVFTLGDSMKGGAVERISNRDSSVRVCVRCGDGQYRFPVSKDAGGSFELSPVAVPVPGTWEQVHRMALSSGDALRRELLACYLATPAMAGSRSAWWNDAVYFAGYTAESGVELWRSGPDPKEAELVADLLPGRGSGSPDELTVYQDRLCFAAEHGTEGRELWSSDGTAAGTSTIQDLAPGKSGGDPAELTLVDGRLVMVVRRPPTQGGAPYLGRLNSLDVIEAVTGRAPHDTVWPTHPRDLTVRGGNAYFAGRGLGSGVELWLTSGTRGETRIVRNILADTGYDSCTELRRNRPKGGPRPKEPRVTQP